MTWFERLRRLLGGKAPATRPDLDVLTCGQVRELLYEFIDEELDPATRERVQRHLDTQPCPCQRLVLFELAFLNRVRGTATDPPVPEGLRDRIVEIIESGDSAASS